MSTVQYFPGSAALSSFRIDQLLNRFKDSDLCVSNISSYYDHFVCIERALDAKKLSRLSELLTYGGNIFDRNSIDNDKNILELTVIPRVGTVSPWSSKATEIAHNCGFYEVNRIERGIHFIIETDRKVIFNEKDLDKLYSLLYDRMTEIIIKNDFDISLLFKTSGVSDLVTIPLMSNGISALQETNNNLGLALSDEEINYLSKSFSTLGRDPTDVELIMFAQANSEHCRHKIFNASWVIDGDRKNYSLFEMIKATHLAQPKGTVVAYSDNAAIMTGRNISLFYPKIPNEDGIAEYVNSDVDINILMKVETHNHPTAIAPFQGASTGAGGEIRDEGATGRGSKPKAGLTGFTVSNLRLSDSVQPWESSYEDTPKRVSSPLSIMIDGPLGGAAFNNEFGRPNVLGYFRVFEQKIHDIHWGYHKPIMLAGGFGIINDSLSHKKNIPDGALLIQLGGPGFRIGIGGGAASSTDIGSNSEDLDFNSVQRGNPEIERRAQEVIDRCWQLADNNPIISIHDVGAGGLSNAFPELVNDSKMGAIFNIRRIPIEEHSMSPSEIWTNESQERYVLAIEKKDLTLFDNIANRERCPYSVVGVSTNDRILKVVDVDKEIEMDDLPSEAVSLKNNPVDISLDIVLGKPPKLQRTINRSIRVNEKLVLDNILIREAIPRVLRHPTVSSKSFLITIGDRSVGGMVCRDQMIGPWQVPVSDFAATVSDYEKHSGEAMAIGERSPIAVINAPSSGRMALAEAITNLIPAGIDKFDDIKLSANWMAACGFDGQDADLYDTVEAVSEFCKCIGLSIPVGKDSLSMKTIFDFNNKKKQVVSPVSLIVTAFATINDVRKSLTPHLVNDIDSLLVFIDLGDFKNRMGGSILAQVYNQIGNEAPDISPDKLASFFNLISVLSSKNMILSYHDRSDGGLITTLIEMSLASHSGLSINLDSIIPNKENFSNESLNDTLIRVLFSEEIGAVIQIPSNYKNEVIDHIRKFDLSSSSHIIGSINADNNIHINYQNKLIWSEKLSVLGKIWSEVSFNISKRRDNPLCAKLEFDTWDDVSDPGINPFLSFDMGDNISAPFISNASRPPVAILREQGCNSNVEMAWAFNKAGFSAVDVHMTDLLSGRVNLSSFKGLVAVGGFSYGDVLGAGEGWARTILFNNLMYDQFSEYFSRKDTFSLGVCNGCQMISALSSIVPGATDWPRFTRNKSERYESRLSTIEILKSPSIFFNGMDGSRIPIVIAHGEGYADYSKSGNQKNTYVSACFVDNYGNKTENYPFNPNGSPEGITAVTSLDGRCTIMMPHPERVLRNVTLSWAPSEWIKNYEYSPWMRMFSNARAWVD
ncbi:phosphoribosylformylglycinamidine synthase [Candidatus Kinetoplastidibacterium galati]|uniref:Phosphoribosylformylglycinamidine synthase n=1 Tax=Candidatus Kinetoplastidibacterium galati TCC219 TaxID=1208921 RepID=M1LTY4_9PROT|nr:phosphoribosylformylglycinamidine synthase [Candidatus Kinetoplastibacterium galatii]AGF49017.1 phosphoribosylformylglycinamidine synthase [Candidatus Kinetoplastibacterium galatii TCC219]